MKQPLEEKTIWSCSRRFWPKHNDKKCVKSTMQSGPWKA